MRGNPWWLVVLLVCACAEQPSAADDHATDDTTSGTSSEDDDTSTGDEGGELVTYHQHVKPILDARCLGCHDVDGVGPFSLASYADASAWAEISVTAVEDRIMPPFSPDDSDCQAIADVRKMAQWERELLREWLDAGTPEGDPELPAKVELELPEAELGEPTHVFPNPIAYTPEPGADEYRCFLVDPELTDDWTFLQALSISTDNWARIHHAIVYSVTPEQVDAVMQVDAADPGPGWECYFGTGVQGTTIIGGYTPGSAVRPYVGETSVPVAAGTQFIVEGHFHETYNTDPVEIDVVGWVFPEPVLRFPHGLSMFTSDFFIPAGAPSVTAPLEGRFIPADQEPVVTEDPNEIQEAKAGLIWGVDFHMHLRGKTAKVELVRSDGTRECLLWVPDWSDEWQGTYVFETPVIANAGDRIEATCEWDNSADNQPIIDGVQLEPTDLWWGFGALDEMCNGSIGMSLD